MLRWLVFPGTGTTKGLLWASCWMIKKNICRCLIFFPLYWLFLFMSPVHASMLSCPKGVTPYAKWPFKFSIHISKAFLAFFFHCTCPLTLKKKVLIWVLLFSWLISYFNAAHLSCPSLLPVGLVQYVSPFHQSVAVSTVRNDIDEPGGKAACLSDYHFLLSGEINYSKWRKITFCGLPENAGSALVIKMWGTKFIRTEANYFINLPFCEKSSKQDTSWSILTLFCRVL